MVELVSPGTTKPQDNIPMFNSAMIGSGCGSGRGASKIIPSLSLVEHPELKANMRMIAIVIAVAALGYVGYKILMPEAPPSAVGLPPVDSVPPAPFLESSTSSAMANMIVNAAGSTSTGIANMFS